MDLRSCTLYYNFTSASKTLEMPFQCTKIKKQISGSISPHFPNLESVPPLPPHFLGWIDALAVKWCNKIVEVMKTCRINPEHCILLWNFSKVWFWKIVQHTGWGNTWHPVQFIIMLKSWYCLFVMLCIVCDAKNCHFHIY
jgi:hypothetical protein